jgi:hypothetical protein
MNFSTGTFVAGLFALCTALFWGTYGPLLSRGHHLMGTEGRLRPFICVGIAYLLVAIVGPIVVMYTTGIDRESGLFSGWTFGGILWSILAGAVGALGAFTLIMALGAGGPSSPVYVMPLVFGCAPVVSAFTSMYLSGNYKISPFFAAGLILVAVGAVTILITAPRPGKKPSHDAHAKKPAAAKPIEPSPRVGKPDPNPYAAPKIAAEPQPESPKPALAKAEPDQPAKSEAKSDGGHPAEVKPDDAWTEPDNA